MPSIFEDKAAALTAAQQRQYEHSKGTHRVAQRESFKLDLMSNRLFMHASNDYVNSETP